MYIYDVYICNLTGPQLQELCLSVSLIISVMQQLDGGFLFFRSWTGLGFQRRNWSPNASIRFGRKQALVVSKTEKMGTIFGLEKL